MLALLPFMILSQLAVNIITQSFQYIEFSQCDVAKHLTSYYFNIIFSSYELLKYYMFKVALFLLFCTKEIFEQVSEFLFFISVLACEDQFKPVIKSLPGKIKRLIKRKGLSSDLAYQDKYLILIST